MFEFCKIGFYCLLNRHDSSLCYPSTTFLLLCITVREEFFTLPCIKPRHLSRWILFVCCSLSTLNYTAFFLFLLFSCSPLFPFRGLDRVKNGNIRCLSQITLEDQMSKNVLGLHIFTYGKLLLKNNSIISDVRYAFIIWLYDMTLAGHKITRLYVWIGSHQNFLPYQVTEIETCS